MPRLTVTLTPDQTAELDDLIAHATQPEVRRRAHIIRLLHAGYTPTHLAGELGISRKTVYNVAHTFELHGIDGLYDRHRSGRPGRADDHYRAVLEDTPALLPRDLGYSNMGWTAGLIGNHMTRETGVTLSLSRLKALLHDMGYEYRRQPACCRPGQSTGNSWPPGESCSASWKRPCLNGWCSPPSHG